jgi:hypothetical protein
MADAHEADIAEWTQGTLQKGSGNQWHRQGDTKNGEHLVPLPITSDGKSTMGNSITVSRSMWLKLVEQTFNQNPAMFLRFYQPGTTVRNVDIDLALVKAGFFVEILAMARRWAAIEELLSERGMVSDVDPKFVADLIKDGVEVRDKAWRKMVQLGEEMGPTFSMDGHKTGRGMGCDCCR